MGLVALGLTLVAELALVLWLRDLTISEYVASRDPVAGTAYVTLLVVFALAPLVVARS